MSSKDVKEQTELTGSALLVYWYLLRKRQGCGVREIQRALGFSSSSTAHYHLEKLKDRNVLTKDQHGNYKINEKIRVARISPFIFVRGLVFPTQLIYAVATIAMCLVFLTLFWKLLIDRTFVVVAALVSAVVLTMALVDLKKTRRILKYSAKIPPTVIR